MSENLSNMELWNKLKTVPADHLKDYKRTGGFAGTGIRPQWRLQIMTEVFGPIGKGWGYEVRRIWREAWAAKTPEYPEGTCQCVYAEVDAWYMLGDEKCFTGSQIGGTIVDRTPDEAYKMSITDALGKCLTAIGVAADVYLDAEADPADKYHHYRQQPEQRSTAAADRGIPPKQPLPDRGPPPQEASRPASPPASNPPASSSSAAPQPASTGQPGGPLLCPQGHSRTKLQNNGKTLLCFECKKEHEYPFAAAGSGAAEAPSGPAAPRQNAEPKF